MNKEKLTCNVQRASSQDYNVVKDNMKIMSRAKEKQVNQSVSFNLDGICSRRNNHNNSYYCLPSKIALNQKKASRRGHQLNLEEYYSPALQTHLEYNVQDSVE